MELSLLKSKLHRVTVTDTQVDYEGSCAIDDNLLDAADIQEYEEIHVWNINNGERFTTYAIRGTRGSGVISLNGAAAHKAAAGDLVIIATFARLDRKELDSFRPKLVYVDGANRIERIGGSIPVQAA